MSSYKYNVYKENYCSKEYTKVISLEQNIHSMPNKAAKAIIMVTDGDKDNEYSFAVDVYSHSLLEKEINLNLIGMNPEMNTILSECRGFKELKIQFDTTLCDAEKRIQLKDESFTCDSMCELIFYDLNVQEINESIDDYSGCCTELILRYFE